MLVAEVQPNPWMAAPFVALLAAIALAPVFFANWWGRHYGKVALGLGAITLLYYVGGLHVMARTIHTASEYISFVCLIGSLFVVSGAGRVQSWDGKVREIKAGDVVWIPPNEKHWHGAAPTTSMVHVATQEALDGKHVAWMEHVSDEQYKAPVGG